MLHYAVVCFVVTVLAAMYRFSGIPAVAAEIAKVLFFLFGALWVVLLAAGAAQRGHQGPRFGIETHRGHLP